MILASGYIESARGPEFDSRNAPLFWPGPAYPPPERSVPMARKGVWSSGMILASGVNGIEHARGPEFDSRNAPLKTSYFV
eukprot:jgi/Mesvir1/12323/Mv26453-RA.1